MALIQLCQEVPSKPFKDSEQAGELSPAQEDRAVAVFADGDPAVVVQPGVRSLDPPAVPATSEFTTVLCRRLHAIGAMRADQLHAPRRQTLPQGVAVGRAVVEQPAFARHLRGTSTAAASSSRSTCR